MYILTQTGWFENSKELIFHVEDKEIEANYHNADWRRTEHFFVISFQGIKYTIVCPEFCNIADRCESIMIIPDFLIPRRLYPIPVYLYAIEYYCNKPEIGQREAAEMTRKHFGMPTFVHTTLGRALKRLVKVIFGEIPKNDTDKTLKRFPTVEDTKALREKAREFLRGKLLEGSLPETIKKGCNLAMAWFKEKKQLLL